VLVTVVTASILSVKFWWTKAMDPATVASEIFLLKLVCILAVIMLVLMAAITIDAVRRWVIIFRQPAFEPAVAIRGQNL
jgi:hypothetical protein